MWLDLRDSQDHLDHLDRRENLAFPDDLVVQASMDGKGKKETHLGSRDPPALQDLQDDQGSSTAPKAPCSPSLPDLTAKCLLTQMERSQPATARMGQRDRREKEDLLDSLLQAFSPEESGVRTI